VSQVAVEKKLIQFLRYGKHEGSIVMTQTVESLSIDEKQIWRNIRRELGDIGITVAAFEANREFIMNWFKSNVATGAFEEQTFEDTSNSQSCEANLSQSLEERGYTISAQSITEAFIPPRKMIQRPRARRVHFPRVVTLTARVFRYIKILLTGEYRLTPSYFVNEYSHQHHIHELSPTIFLPRAADIGPDVRSALSISYSALTWL
jgi:hypothetical protein